MTRKSLRISKDLALPLELVSRTAGILAQKGAGKSNAAVVMAEELHAAGLHWIAIDPKGDWWGVRADTDGKPGGLDVPIFGGEHADVALDPDPAKARELADAIVEDGISCVIDVSEFSEGEKIRFLGGAGSTDGFAHRLYQRKRRTQEPTHLFLEEADDYIPQNPKGKEKLVDVFGRIVRMGRQRGLGATMVTQRSARIHKDVLTQVDALIVLRIIGPQDRDAIEGWLKYHGQAREILSSLAELGNGEAWIWSPEWLKVTKRIRFRRRESYDSGSTPVIGKGDRRAVTLADIDLGALEQRMAAAIEKQKAADPTELAKQLRERDRKIAALERQLSERNPETVEVEKVVEIPAVPEGVPDRLDKLSGRIGTVASDLHLINDELDTMRWELEELKRKDWANARGAGSGTPRAAIRGRTGPSQEAAVGVRSPRPAKPAAEGGAINGPQRKVLDALAWWEAVGRASVTRLQLAAVAGYHPRTGAFTDAIGALNAAGHVHLPRAGEVALTDAGRSLANAPGTPPTTDELQRMFLDLVGENRGRVLRAIIASYPESISRVDLAEQTNYHPRTGAFTDALGYFNKLGLTEIPQPGYIVATGALFL